MGLLPFLCHEHTTVWSTAEGHIVHDASVENDVGWGAVCTVTSVPLRFHITTQPASHVTRALEHWLFTSCFESLLETLTTAVFAHFATWDFGSVSTLTF